MAKVSSIVLITMKEMARFKGFTNINGCVSDHKFSNMLIGLIDEYGVLVDDDSDYSAEDWKKEQIQRIVDLEEMKISDIVVDDKTDIFSVALACKKRGVMPYWLTKTIAFSYFNLNADFEEQALKKRMMKDSGLLAFEPEIIQLVTDRYNEAKKDITGAMSESNDYVMLLKKAWHTGFEYEKNYRGCAQCTLLAAREAFGIFDEKVFESASALSAGMALCGDGVCGGYSGGLMNIGLIAARTLDDLKTKSKENQSKGMMLGQKLHDKFIACYGSVICCDIHDSIFGRSFLIRDSKNKEPFEAAGAHSDKCTSVVAMSLYMLGQLYGYDYLKENSKS